MEKAQERLRKQMKKFKEDLEAKTRDNPLHRWKLFGKTPLQGRLEVIAEKARNIPLGIRISGIKDKEAGAGKGKDSNCLLCPVLVNLRVLIKWSTLF